MSLEQGLELLRSNYHITAMAENERQVVVTLISDLKLAEAASLTRLGWVILDNNVVAFNKAKPDEELGVTADLDPDDPQGGALAATICGCESLSEPPPDQPDSTETN